MARRRRMTEEPAFSIDATPALAASAPIEQPAESTSRKVIAIRLTDDGKVDLDGMRKATIDSLKHALKGSALFKSDDEAENELALKKAVYAQVVPALYGVLGAAEALVVSKRMQLPYNDVRSVMEYTESDISVLSDPTATVLAKRMPEGFGWTEEVTLALTLVSIHQQKMIALEELKARTTKKLVDIDNKKVADTVQ